MSRHTRYHVNQSQVARVTPSNPRTPSPWDVQTNRHTGQMVIKITPSSTHTSRTAVPSIAHQHSYWDQHGAYNGRDGFNADSGSFSHTTRSPYTQVSASCQQPPRRSYVTTNAGQSFDHITPDGIAMADKKFTDECIKYHNNYRSRHGVSNLRHNKDISAQAQKWADNLASKNQFAHCPDAERRHKGEPMGENIAMKWTSGGEDFTGEMVSDQWYSENERYSYNTNSGPRTGHFTQMVWKDSKEFGVGKAKTKDGKWIVVANYYPVGNMWGKNADNVLPLREGDNRGGIRGLFTGRDSKKDSSGQTTSSGASSTPSDVSGGGRTVSRHVREERGPGGYVKTIVTETVVDANGRKTTTTTESVKSGDSDGAASADLDSRLKSNDKGKTYAYTSQSSNDSGGSSKDKDKKEKEKKPQKMKDFIDEVVKYHNKYRKKHSKVGDVKHSKELDVLAQRWADHLAASSSLKHSNDTYKGDPLGENVATKWSSVGADYTGQEVVDQWYDEVQKYDFRFNDFRPGTGHFTQIVWKNSKEVGVGKSFGKDGRVFVVCNYYPAGNVVGQFKDNVFPEK